MTPLTAEDLQLVAGTVKDFFGKSLGLPATFAASCLAEREFKTPGFTGVVGLSGKYQGHVIVSADRAMLREALPM